ncbi:hypothetical protein DESC_500018 [Desulfosarcina cetonica]|nr:hypothetical protein DESC_500018 [Desulfosarcina cetonica]
MHFQAKEVIAHPAGAGAHQARAGVAGIAGFEVIVQIEAQGGIPLLGDVGFRIDAAATGLDLQHGLGAGAGVGPVEGHIAQVGIFQGRQGALPDVGVNHVGSGGRKIAASRQIGLQAGRKRRRAWQDGAQPVDIDVARLDVAVVGNGESAASRSAVSDHILEGLGQLRFEDVDQAVPVGIGEHASLLLIDPGVALQRINGFFGYLGFHGSPIRS